VHPKEISQLVQHELNIIQNMFEDVLTAPIEWNVWSLDKSYRVASFKASVRESSDSETQRQIKADIDNRMAKYCQNVTVQIS
jgi:hypothetical protein